MSGIVGSKLNIRGSGLVGSLGTDGQHLLSAGAGKTNVFETVAAGANNAPYFEAFLPSDQAISNGTFTKLAAATENFDSGSSYDKDTNYRWTPQTAGKYYIYGQMSYQGGADNLAHTIAVIYVNGSAVRTMDSRWQMGGGSEHFAIGNSQGIYALVDLDGDTDYVELFMKLNTNSGSGNIMIGGANGADAGNCYFGGFFLT